MAMGLRSLGPAITLKSKARSAILRAIGPSTPSMAKPLGCGTAGTRPGVGLRPTTFVQAAGLRSEPPMSVPQASGCMPQASATAAPPLLPPQVRSRCHGLRVAPKSGL